MKLKLRRINRGVVLGVVVIIGFIAYLFIDAAIFRSSEADKIQSVISGFVNEAAQVCVYTGDTGDTAAVKKFKDQMAEGCKTVTNKYWDVSEAVNKRNENDFYGNYTTTKDDVLLEISYMTDDRISESVLNSDYLTDIQCSVSFDKIKRNGHDGATVTFSVEYVYTGKGEAVFLSPSGHKYVSAQPDAKDSDTEQYTFELYKDGGEWKIVGFSWY